MLCSVVDWVIVGRSVTVCLLCRGFCWSVREARARNLCVYGAWLGVTSYIHWETQTPRALDIDTRAATVGASTHSIAKTLLEILFRAQTPAVFRPFVAFVAPQCFSRQPQYGAKSGPQPTQSESGGAALADR